jgi:hypothetical protein
MAKVFTITEGLENMGALRTGGQGSVYKARRVGEIISAVKLLPTPILNESMDDKHFRDFQNEVQKLKKVNQVPNPNVVKILSPSSRWSSLKALTWKNCLSLPTIPSSLLRKPPRWPNNFLAL